MKAGIKSDQQEEWFIIELEGRTMNLLVTGGAGFIGSNFIRYLIKKYPDYRIINLDKLTYAGNLNNLSDIANHPQYTFILGDIVDRELVNQIMKKYQINRVINFAAESHVDRSITDSAVFIKSNVLGTQTLLDISYKNQIDRFIQISTDEVYGTLGAEGYFTEETPLAPNSPYSASKAAADLLVRSYYNTYQMDVNIIRCSNNYGPFQYLEKLIPLMITKALKDEPLPVYGDGLNVRDWLHVDDHCRAIDLVLHHGKSGEIYNVGGHNERSNIEIVKEILNYLGKSHALINYVADRKGHDRRYAIDPDKITQELGWRQTHEFDKGLKETIEWYLENQEWWKPVADKQLTHI